MYVIISTQSTRRRRNLRNLLYGVHHSVVTLSFSLNIAYCTAISVPTTFYSQKETSRVRVQNTDTRKHANTHTTQRRERLVKPFGVRHVTCYHAAA